MSLARTALFDARQALAPIHSCIPEMREMLG